MISIIAITILFAMCMAMEVVVVNDKGLILWGFGNRPLLPAVAFVIQNKTVIFSCSIAGWITGIFLSFLRSPNTTVFICLSIIVVTFGAAAILLLIQWTSSLREIIHAAGFPM